jgi:hypothetical protein
MLLHFGPRGVRIWSDLRRLRYSCPFLTKSEEVGRINRYIQGVLDVNVPLGPDLQKLPVAMAYPFDACEMPLNPLELDSKIALVGRGHCNFTDKVCPICFYHQMLPLSQTLNTD